MINPQLVADIINAGHIVCHPLEKAECNPHEVWYVINAERIVCHQADGKIHACGRDAIPRVARITCSPAAKLHTKPVGLDIKKHLSVLFYIQADGLGM